MTHIKSKLITTAIIMAFAATPALADHHEGDAMKAGDHMMKKGGDMMTSTAQSMTAEQRMKAEAKIMDSMSVQDKASFMALSPKARKMMMDQKLSGGDYMAGNAIMSGDVDAGQVLQMNEPKNPTMGDNDVLMSNGATPDVDKVLAMEAQESDGMLMNNAIVVPTVGGAEVLTTVSCPVGAEAQPDGTCMLTGDSDLMLESTSSMSTMSTGTMMDTQISTSTTGRFTTEGKPYMGTLDPATAFGNR